MSIKDGIVPDQLKIASVVPIHKKESKNNFTNYRPKYLKDLSLIDVFHS